MLEEIFTENLDFVQDLKKENEKLKEKMIELENKVAYTCETTW